MTTSKGTIQGYNGIASVDKKHQIIIGADAFGAGQESHTLKPILKGIKQRYNKLGLSDDVFADGVIVTADTGFASESNMEYLHENGINAYIPDNQFRSRDPRFKDQKKKHPRKSRAKKGSTKTFPAGDFVFNENGMSCICPNGEMLSPRGIIKDTNGNQSARFEGRLTQCRNCPLKSQCMKNPKSADHRKGAGRQVSFLIGKNNASKHTDWMKERVDSDKGKQIYSHRMSVVEPVFGNMESNKHLTRFSLRGLEKVNAQWKLYCIMHNIEKLANYGSLAAWIRKSRHNAMGLLRLFMLNVPYNDEYENYEMIRGIGWGNEIMTATYQLIFKNTKSVLMDGPGRVFLQPRYIKGRQFVILGALRRARNLDLKKAEASVFLYKMLQ